MSSWIMAMAIFLIAVSTFIAVLIIGRSRGRGASSSRFSPGSHALSVKDAADMDHKLGEDRADRLIAEKYGRSPRSSRRGLRLRK